MPDPTASGGIEIEASPRIVYELVSDPGVLAEISEEYTGYRWLGPVRTTQVGAKFRGYNRRGRRAWFTVSTIAEAAPGREFSIEVRALSVIPVSRWQYDIDPLASGGSKVRESTWDRRPRWFHLPTRLLSGVADRAALNQAHISTTLRRLKERAERVSSSAR